MVPGQTEFEANAHVLVLTNNPQDKFVVWFSCQNGRNRVPNCFQFRANGIARNVHGIQGWEGAPGGPGGHPAQEFDAFVFFFTKSKDNVKNSEFF